MENNNYSRIFYALLMVILGLVVLGGCQKTETAKQPLALTQGQQVQNMPAVPYTRGPTSAPDTVKGPDRALPNN